MLVFLQLGLDIGELITEVQDNMVSFYRSIIHVHSKELILNVRWCEMPQSGSLQLLISQHFLGRILHLQQIAVIMCLKFASTLACLHQCWVYPEVYTHNYLHIKPPANSWWHFCDGLQRQVCHVDQVWGNTPEQRRQPKIAVYTLRWYSFDLGLAIAQEDAGTDIPIFLR